MFLNVGKFSLENAPYLARTNLLITHRRVELDAKYHFI